MDKTNKIDDSKSKWVERLSKRKSVTSKIKEEDLQEILRMVKRVKL